MPLHAVWRAQIILDRQETMWPVRTMQSMLSQEREMPGGCSRAVQETRKASRSELRATQAEVIRSSTRHLREFQHG